MFVGTIDEALSALEALKEIEKDRLGGQTPVRIVAASEIPWYAAYPSFELGYLKSNGELSARKTKKPCVVIR